MSKRRIRAEKTASLILIIMISMMAFISCQLSPAVAYDNFITDLDIIYRFEEVAFNVEFGRYSSIFQSDIEYIIRDLETLNLNDSEANRINNMFIKSAKSFISASEYYLDADHTSGIRSHAYAISKYEEALTAYHKYIEE